MKFNPQWLMQMMAQRNPGLLQQFQQFQQMMQTNPQLRQQYQQFRSNMSDPGKREQAMNDAMQKVNELPPIGNANNNTGNQVIAGLNNTINNG